MEKLQKDLKTKGVNLFTKYMLWYLICKTYDMDMLLELLVIMNTMPKVVLQVKGKNFSSN